MKKNTMFAILFALVGAFALPTFAHSKAVAGGEVAGQAEAVDLLDGNWFQSDCYGCPGDSTPGQVSARQSAYYDAAKVATAKQKAWVHASAATKGTAQMEMIEAQTKCIETSLLSYVKAQYALEIGRVLDLAGDVAQAKTSYKDAKRYAHAATLIKDNDAWVGKNGANVPQTSKEMGATYEKLAQRALDRLGE